MPTFKLDGKDIPFEPGESIIKAAYRQGVEIPHYCWHPGLSAPANCRMCLVELKPKEGQRAMMLDVLQWDPKTEAYVTSNKPKLQPACYTAAAEGMEVLSDTSAHVVQARRAVQEFLLLNHPVDCPICDQAGECKLQDYWMEHGQYQKRMRDEPIHKPKAVVFGPTIVYDAERCVMCTRCIRFMDEVAKDPVLEMRERGNLNEITVAPGRELTGKYTFMTEHVCPVGALTTKDFRFKARVWFMKSAPSICQGCATGCNAHLDYDPRYNRVYRYRPRDNEAVNKYWMCDDGMLSYRRAHENRVLEASVAGRPVPVAKALGEAKTVLMDGDEPVSTMAVVLSAQHSVEDNFALLHLAKTFLKARATYVIGLGEGPADDILIHKDKNPNSAGVRTLAPDARSFADLASAIRAGQVTHLLCLGGETAGSLDGDLAALQPAKGIVCLAAWSGAMSRSSRVVLPVASWAETSGTFVNAKGMHQRADKAIEPLGSAKPAWKLVAELGRALGYEMPWTSLLELRARLPVSTGPQLGTSPAAPRPVALAAGAPASGASVPPPLPKRTTPPSA
jgi:NADH-quinone oxidoreductase subunit G